MPRTVARYLFICESHGEFGSAPISSSVAPNPAVQCPLCGAMAEVWVGASISSTSVADRRPPLDAEPHLALV
jgi:hypothetical protein